MARKITATVDSEQRIIVDQFQIDPANFTLGSQSNVSISSPVDRSLLVYDNSSQNWIDSQITLPSGTGTVALASDSIDADQLTGTIDDARMPDLVTSAVQTVSTISTLGGLTMTALGSTTGGAVVFREGTNNGTNAIKLQAPAQVDAVGPFGTLDIIFPNSAGTMALTSDLSSFITATSTNTLTNKTLTAPALTGIVDMTHVTGVSAGSETQGNANNAISISAGDDGSGGSLGSMKIFGANGTNYITFNNVNSDMVIGDLINEDTSTVKILGQVRMSPATSVDTSVLNITLEAGMRYVNTYNISGRTWTLPALANNFGKGKTITIINASNQTITVNRSTNSITASIADTGQGIQSVTGNTFSVLKGGVADVIYTDASSVVVFGSGVVNA